MTTTLGHHVDFICVSIWVLCTTVMEPFFDVQPLNPDQVKPLPGKERKNKKAALGF